MIYFDARALRVAEHCGGVALNGFALDHVLLERDGEDLFVVATDGRVLVSAREKVLSAGVDDPRAFKLLVPRWVALGAHAWRPSGSKGRRRKPGLRRCSFASSRWRIGDLNVTDFVVEEDVDDMPTPASYSKTAVPSDPPGLEFPDWRAVVGRTGRDLSAGQEFSLDLVSEVLETFRAVGGDTIGRWTDRVRTWSNSDGVTLACGDDLLASIAKMVRP